MRVLGGYGWDAAGAAGTGAAALTLAGIPDMALQVIAAAGLGILVWNTTARSMVRRWAKTLKAEKVVVWVKSDTIETLRTYDSELEGRFEDIHAKLGGTPRIKGEQDPASVVVRALESSAHQARERGAGRTKAT